ncbi:MAG: lipopolysaccharide heptosyltransferase I, partial [Herbaspirillum sp.]
AYVDLVRLNTHVRHVIPIALRRWRKSLLAATTRAEIAAFYHLLRREPYDFVFDTQGLLKTGLVMRLARLADSGQRIGLANATEGSGYESLSKLFHTRSVTVDRRAHAVLRARLVAAAAFDQMVEGIPDFALTPPDTTANHPNWLPTRPYAVFFHATARAAKQWSVEAWVAIAAILEKRDWPVLLPWGSDSERRAAEQLAARMPNARVLPRLSMMEAVLLAQRASLVIGVDTGLTHIAAAYCRPTIELYSDSPRWKTEGNWSSNVINLGDTRQPPTVAEVEKAVLTLLH